MTEIIERLKPCPFCGGDNVETFGPYGWYRQWGISHSCSSFYSGTSEMMQGFGCEADAIAAWNTRSEASLQGRPDVERARAIVGRLVEGDSDNPERVARADRYYDGLEDNSLAIQAAIAALAGDTHTHETE